MSARRFTINMQRNRVLVVGLKGNMQGTEMAVNNFVHAIGGRIKFDYLMHETPAFDGYRLPGNRIFTIPRKSREPLAYRRELIRLFERHAGEWSGVWLNTGNLANIDSLIMAERYGIPQRILHAHSDTWLGGTRQVAMTKIHQQRALALSTDRWACSEAAGKLFFGTLPFTIVVDAIPLKKYAFSSQGRKRIRDEYNLGDRFVVGSVGALINCKNHAFIVRLLPKISELIPSACAILVGEGPGRDGLVTLAKKLGVSDRLLLVGNQRDVPAYLSAMDVFVFPSVHEGLGLAQVEAQVNGLPVITSSACTHEVAITDAIRFLDLDDEGAWIDALCSARRSCVSLGDGAKRFDLASEGETLVNLFSPGMKSESD